LLSFKPAEGWVFENDSWIIAGIHDGSRTGIKGFVKLPDDLLVWVQC
jgi:hypothetical protein